MIPKLIKSAESKAGVSCLDTLSNTRCATFLASSSVANGWCPEITGINGWSIYKVVST